MLRVTTYQWAQERDTLTNDEPLFVSYFFLILHQIEENKEREIAIEIEIQIQRERERAKFGWLLYNYSTMGFKKYKLWMCVCVCVFVPNGARCWIKLLDTKKEEAIVYYSFGLRAPSSLCCMNLAKRSNSIPAELLLEIWALSSHQTPSSRLREVLHPTRPMVRLLRAKLRPSSAIQSNELATNNKQQRATCWYLNAINYLAHFFAKRRRDKWPAQKGGWMQES